jgi:hypothetical protein
MTDINESSANELYQSAVDAFPHTTKRQHAIDPIRIVQLNWTPFVGLKTLLVRGTAVNEGRTYKPIVLFKQVEYGTGIPLRASDGRDYLLRPLSAENNDVLLRCDCKDFYWRFNYYDHLDKSLYGRKRSKYESQGGPPANPLEMPGMCKHLMKMLLALRDAELLL